MSKYPSTKVRPYGDFTSTDQASVRCIALEAASRCLQGQVFGESGVTSVDVVRTADRFVKYIETGEV